MLRVISSIILLSLLSMPAIAGKTVKLPKETKRVKIEKLGFIESMDDIIQKNYQYLAYKKTKKKTGEWEIHIAGNYTAGAKLTKKNVEKKALKAAVAGEKYFNIGYKFTGKPKDKRVSETRVYIKDGKPSRVVHVLVTRKYDKTAKAEKTLSFPWPSN